MDSQRAQGPRTAAALGPGLYYELRYEALVADPARECAALCAFLEVPYDPAMLRFHERGAGTGAARSRPVGGRRGLAVTPGLRDWRSQLSLEEVERFEATGGDLLEELGYERSVAPDQRTLREAEHVREAFANVMRLRARELPQRW